MSDNAWMIAKAIGGAALLGFGFKIVGALEKTACSFEKTASAIERWERKTPDLKNKGMDLKLAIREGAQVEADADADESEHTTATKHAAPAAAAEDAKPAKKFKSGRKEERSFSFTIPASTHTVLKNL